MTEDEAISLLRERLNRLDNTYRDRMPKWNTNDHMALRIVLRLADNQRDEQARLFHDLLLRDDVVRSVR